MSLTVTITPGTDLESLVERNIADCLTGTRVLDAQNLKREQRHDQVRGAAASDFRDKTSECDTDRLAIVS